MLMILAGNVDQLADHARDMSNSLGDGTGRFAYLRSLIDQRQLIARVEWNPDSRVESVLCSRAQECPFGRGIWYSAEREKWPDESD